MCDNRLKIGACLCFIGGSALAGPPIPMTRLSILWEVNAGTAERPDWMTTISLDERAKFKSLKQIAYIKAEISTAPLYRLRNARSEHMDSAITGEGDYLTEFAEGSPWVSANAVPGLSPISRLWNRSTGDHATTTPHNLNLYPAYQADSNYGGRYGYQRFGELEQNPINPAHIQLR